VSAYRDGDAVVVLMPARFSVAEEREWVRRMVTRLERRDVRRRPSDAGLEHRAAELSRRYLDGRAVPASVRWVDNQHARWGSCSVDDSAIRLSRRLQGMPPWVLDYVLLHELAHLLVPGHGSDFWQLVSRFPRCERARGYLAGVSDDAKGLHWNDDDGS
jgi:predicted metal-dependent hydrolase